MGDRLGMALLQREGHRLKLTAAGEILHRQSVAPHHLSKRRCPSSTFSGA
ncbi:hypothetical protein [Ensifer sp. 4252]